MTRYEMLSTISETMTDIADLDSLISYFYSGQYEYYDGFTDKDLENFYNDEFGANETLDK